ncbi:MAG: hypothetical protein SOZ17_00790 [Agathobacter sp.]|nr:hypothetical protein [Agathobacter sp.]
MDREALINQLKTAFNDGVEEKKDNKDVEYKADTNSLLINKAVEAQILDARNVEIKPMSEEEIFARLHKERRNQ